MKNNFLSFVLTFGFLFSSPAFCEFDGKLGLKILGNLYPELASEFWAGGGANVYALWESGFALDFEYDWNQIRTLSTNLTSPTSTSFSGTDVSSFTVAPGIALSKSEFLFKGALKLGVLGSKFAGGAVLSGDWITPTGFTVGIHSTFLSELKSDPTSFYNVGIGLGFLL